ncbi:hypothetical protein FACS1894103_4390 [Campylobacterota bacterium]|nr:hypothetical protein FACS1894103_4390 [Campylobacterota bacterium]
MFALSSAFKIQLIVNQNLIMNNLEGYEKLYLIGGSVSWANIRGFLSHNINGLRIYEEENYNAVRVDAWGVSDLDLFRESVRIFSQEKSPFFAIIQTAGYHRPYTIPKDNAGFIIKELDSQTVSNNSFNSIEEYNSLRFADHALGEFFRLVKETPYYKDTIFVIFGDHGLSASRSDNVPRGYVTHNLINHHVPLIIHAPALLEPKVIERTASQIDVMPTIAGLIGVPYVTRAMGRDMFDPVYEDREMAMMSDSGIYAVSGDYLYSSRLGHIGLYKFADADYDKDIKEENPELFDGMEGMARGIYETSRYMLYHNSRE